MRRRVRLGALPLKPLHCGRFHTAMSGGSLRVWVTNLLRVCFRLTYGACKAGPLPGASILSSFAVACRGGRHFQPFLRMPLYRAREGDVGARLLREPASHSQGARTALNSLRRVTHDMGGVWPYFNEQGQAPRQALQDFQDEPESDSGMEAEVTVLFTALTPGYAPETFTANLHIPATYVDAENAFRAARAPLRTRLFPHVIDASPQPLAGHAVFVCCPYWLGISLVVCIDLLQLDGRVFAVRAPPYCDRHRLLQLAALQANAPVDVFAGFYEDPLPDGVDIHLFPGETIRFVQSGQLRTPPASLTQLLLDVTVAGPAASADYRAFKYVCHRDGPVLQRPAGL